MGSAVAGEFGGDVAVEGDAGFGGLEGEGAVEVRGDADEEATAVGVGGDGVGDGVAGSGEIGDNVSDDFADAAQGGFGGV